jgi:hypothetical protein
MILRRLFSKGTKPTSVAVVRQSHPEECLYYTPTQRAIDRLWPLPEEHGRHAAAVVEHVLRSNNVTRGDLRKALLDVYREAVFAEKAYAAGIRPKAFAAAAGETR